jgi:hypothetical protein
MSRIVVEYMPSLLSFKAKELIEKFVTPSMIAHDGSSSQYEIDQCKSICEEYKLTKEVIQINQFILDGVHYLEL